MLEFNDISVYELLIEVGQKYAISPSMSIASEDYFQKLLAEYEGERSLDKIQVWLEEKIANDFLVFTERPKWIQSPQWPFASGKPMIFVDQIDVKQDASSVTQKVLHDDTSFYLFIPQDRGELEVVVQQF